MKENSNRKVFQNFTGTINIPDNVIESTVQYMQQYDKLNKESYVWWAGKFVNDRYANVDLVIFPPKSANSFGNVTLDRNSIHFMHSRIRDEGLILLAELHTHPPAAKGQSYLDSINPAATYEGFVSVVIPNFCKGGIGDFSSCYVYRYKNNYSWKEMDTLEKKNLFSIKSHD